VNLPYGGLPNRRQAGREQDWEDFSCGVPRQNAWLGKVSVRDRAKGEDEFMNVYLIGYRGTGKTTVGRELAERLRAVAVDADQWLEAAAGCSIRELFAAGGEQLFRDHESEAVRVLTARDGLVVAWGGGVILRPENRVALRNGFTVWLRATPATLWKRIAGDPSTGERRPNLTAAGGLEEIEQVLAARTPLYAAAADWEIDTERAAPAEIAAFIAARLAESATAAGGRE